MVEFKASKIFVISAIGEAFTILPPIVARFLIGKDPKSFKLSFNEGMDSETTTEFIKLETVALAPMMHFLSLTFIPEEIPFDEDMLSEDDIEL